MFKCGVTGKVTQAGEPCQKVVVATRTVEYVNFVPDEFGNIWHEGKLCRRVESRGTEIVKEINVSPEGLARLQKESEGIH